MACSCTLLSQMFTFLGTLVVHSDPGKGSSSWHRTERAKRSWSRRVEFLMWYGSPVDTVRSTRKPLYVNFIMNPFCLDKFPTGSSDTAKFACRVSESLWHNGVRWLMDRILLLWQVACPVRVGDVTARCRNSSSSAGNNLLEKDLRTIRCVT